SLSDGDQELAALQRDQAQDVPQTEGVGRSEAEAGSLIVNKEFDADTLLDVRNPVNEGEVALFRVEAAEQVTDNLPAQIQYTTNPDKVVEQVRALNGNAIVRQVKATPAMIKPTDIPDEF